ncbi:flavin reductase family protein [Streptomyces mirabilis]|uniref:flavin reductase family protein n=1 Tax=Streptomyces mirabilis TaxID=68239 RepID=UPI0036BBA93B
MGEVAQRAECSPAYGIHLLGEDSRKLARRFSTTGIDRFDHPAIGYDDGLTSVAGAVAWLECRMVDRIPAGDHHMVLAAPGQGRARRPGPEQTAAVPRPPLHLGHGAEGGDEAVKKAARRQRGAQERGSVSI